MSYQIELMFENVERAFEMGLISEKERDEAIDNIMDYAESE